jgi:hypothetical protein
MTWVFDWTQVIVGERSTNFKSVLHFSDNLIDPEKCLWPKPVTLRTMTRGVRMQKPHHTKMTWSMAFCVRHETLDCARGSPEQKSPIALATD